MKIKLLMLGLTLIMVNPTVLATTEAQSSNQHSNYLKWELQSALYNDNAAQVKKLVQKNKGLVNEPYNHQTPLCLACKMGKLELAKLLVANGANVNQEYKDSWSQTTPLREALDHDHFEIAEFLIAQDANVNHCESGWYKNTILMDAVLAGSPKRVEFLIRHNAKLDLQNKEGKTALIWAAWLLIRNKIQALEIAELLLNHGANPNLQDYDGNSALIIATEDAHHDFNFIKLLVEYKADVNAQNKENRTAIMYATFVGELNTVTLLLQYGANPDLGRILEFTPLHAALRFNHDHRIAKSIALLLIFHGADVNLSSEYASPLMQAMGGDHNDVAKILILFGADLNMQTKALGLTALMKTVLYNNLEMAKLLIAQGALINLKNLHNETALDMAIELVKRNHGKQEMIDLIKSAGGMRSCDLPD